MKQLKFIREPGYIYDLIFIFVYHFNKNYCLSNYVNYDKQNEDIDFFNASMYEFSKIISDKMRIFFHIKEHGKCFFSESYFKPYENKFSSEYSYMYLQNLLLNNGEVIKKIYSYYFPEGDQNSVVGENIEIIDISNLIDESSYDENIKINLYSFFINPEPILQKLRNELSAINVLLTKYYEKNYQMIIDFQNDISYDKLEANFDKVNTQKYTLSSYEKIYFSVCLLSKNCIKSHFIENEAIVLLGYDYEDAITYYISKESNISLDEVANVLSEKNRIDILDIILKKEEISIRDLENELNISGTNAYYHITMMLKANMLKSRNQGKTVLYSLNKKQFGSIIKHLKKYSN